MEGLARRVLSALSAVHARGFVHRDVKPSNLLLAKEGAKLCDFGIARLDGATTLTASAALIGSLRYMAPEQQRLGRADARSDLYALGLVLYEALAGGIPGERPLPSGVPRRLRTLLARLLEEKSEQRPAHAEAALKLLDRRVPVGVLSVGGATAVALGAFLVVGPSQVSPTATEGVRKAAVEEKLATKEAATLKYPEPQVLDDAQQERALPVPQNAHAQERIQKRADAFEEPQKLAEPASAKKSELLEAPTPLPEKNPPPFQGKTLPVKLDTKRAKGTTSKQRKP